ncbi:protein-disulfide reductase DsbD domain-containing protein [Nitratireductor luteus]|uniref:protein-disulfide reductase DsbD domain-containing protein n=1 Tax=Nitratireductor luteus TaxID=2976980 RepID=UPI00223F3500|nr:protein-disulfide reductase DsbD domain-containing protein [Nitratireductor luteus]
MRFASLSLRFRPGRHIFAVMKTLLLASALLVASGSLALPSSSQWMESEGGAVRIVSTGLSDARGVASGALEIRLKPGWKTYWRAPGEAGIPPQIELSPSSAAQAVEIHYPAPAWVTDEYSTWAGYKHSVALPLTFRMEAANSGGIIEGEVLLGICETICIPLQAAFSFDSGADPDNPQDALLVQRAFMALPGQPREGLRIVKAERRPGEIILSADIAGDPDAAQLFLAGADGLQLGVPRHMGGGRFSVSLMGGTPQGEGREQEISYTLVQAEEAVTGEIQVPQEIR